MDALIHRHGIERAKVTRSNSGTASVLDAYLTGSPLGCAKSAREYRLLATKIPSGSRLSGLVNLDIRFFGLAQSQERMERFAESVTKGRPTALRDNVRPVSGRMAALEVSGTAAPSSPGSASNLLFPVGGSNAGTDGADQLR